MSNIGPQKGLKIQNILVNITVIVRKMFILLFLRIAAKNDKILTNSFWRKIYEQ